jgi:hypothetical protein
MKIDKSKPLEELVGINRGVVRQKLARIHCMTPIIDQARIACPTDLWDAPVELRRGWVKCVIDTIVEYRDEYTSVMLRRPTELHNLTVFD